MTKTLTYKATAAGDKNKSHDDRLLRLSALLIIIIGVLHAVAMVYFLYWRVEWYDIMMHFAGGFWAAVTVLWLYFFSGYIKARPMTKKEAFLASVVLTLLVGVLWEVFEVFLGAPDVRVHEPYYLDTAIDLVMDTLGALLAYGYFYILYLKKENGRQA